jgi:hypothetical protein
MQQLYLKQGHPDRQIKVTPGPTHMDAIRKLAVGEVSEDQVFVGQMNLCNDRHDRSGEKFPKAYLERFAQTLPGKSVLKGHDYSSLPVGRFLDAEIVETDGVSHLLTTYYMLKSADLIPLIEGGVVKDVSIGFYGDRKDCDICSRDYEGYWKGEEDPCPHTIGFDYDGKLCTVTWSGNTEKVEAVEGSFVYLGCQYDAQSVPMGSNGIDPTYVAKSAHFRNLAQSEEAEEARKLRESPYFRNGEKPGPPSMLSPVKAPVVEPPAAPVKDAEQMRLAAYGLAYIKVLRDRLVSRYKAMGMEQVGDLLASQFAVVPVTKAEEVLAEAEKAFEQKFPPVGKAEQAGVDPPRGSGLMAPQRMHRGGF